MRALRGQQLCQTTSSLLRQYHNHLCVWYCDWLTMIQTFTVGQHVQAYVTSVKKSGLSVNIISDVAHVKVCCLLSPSLIQIGNLSSRGNL